QLAIATLLDDLVARGRTDNLAGLLSRFQLHGLRLPGPDDPALRTLTGAEIRAAGRTEVALAPLYELTGQQFPAPAPPDLTADAVVVDNGGGADWLELAESLVVAPGDTADDLRARFPDLAILNPGVRFDEPLVPGTVLTT